MKNTPKPVVTTIAIATLITLVVGGVLVAINLSKPETENAPTSTSTYTDRFIDKDLIMMETPDLVKAPSTEAIAQFGEQEAREGTAWAEAFATYTAYMPGLWSQVTDPSKPESKRVPTPENYEELERFMTTQGRLKLAETTGTQEAIDKGLNGSLAIVPNNSSDIEWHLMPLRPTIDSNIPASSFNVISTTVGPPSSYNNQPTLKVTFNDYHIFDWKKDGKPMAGEVGRENVFYLAQTNDPERPWVLDNWEIKELPVREMKPRIDYATETPTES